MRGWTAGPRVPGVGYSMGIGGGEGHRRGEGYRRGIEDERGTVYPREVQYIRGRYSIYYYLVHDWILENALDLGIF